MLSANGTFLYLQEVNDEIRNYDNTRCFGIIALGLQVVSPMLYSNRQRHKVALQRSACKRSKQNNCMCFELCVADRPWKKRISINPPALDRQWNKRIAINPPALDRPWKIRNINWSARPRPHPYMFWESGLVNGGTLPPKSIMSTLLPLSYHVSHIV